MTTVVFATLGQERFPEAPQQFLVIKLPDGVQIDLTRLELLPQPFLKGLVGKEFLPVGKPAAGRSAEKERGKDLFEDIQVLDPLDEDESRQQEQLIEIGCQPSLQSFIEFEYVLNAYGNSCCLELIDETEHAVPCDDFFARKSAIRAKTGGNRTGIRTGRGGGLPGT